MIKIITFVLLLFTAPAMAQVIINTSGLTDEQKAQLVVQAEAMKKNQTIESLNPEKLNEWVTLGKNIGLAITATAKELGVAADSFLNSTTGKITVGLIVWHYAGKDIINLVGGTIAWIILTSIVIWSFRFFHMTKRVTTKLEGGKTETKYVARFTFNSNDARAASAAVHVAAFFLITTISSIIIFN